MEVSVLIVYVNCICVGISIMMTKYLDKKLTRRKDLFWLMLLIHGHLALLPLGLQQGSTSWRECVAEVTAQLMVSRKQRESQEGQSPNILFKCTSLVS
jgi:hypothetical protein